MGMARSLSECTDEMFRALGRVVTVGALIELRMFYVVDQWGSRDSDDQGKSMSALVQRFEEIRRSFGKENIALQHGLVEIVAEARKVMEERNAAIHAIRTNDDQAWSSQPMDDGEAEPRMPVLADMPSLIERMSDVALKLNSFVSSPVIRPEHDRQPCACGCGELTPSKWRPGHRAAAINERINRLVDGDVMTFLASVDEHAAAEAVAAD